MEENFPLSSLKKYSRITVRNPLCNPGGGREGIHVRIAKGISRRISEDTAEGIPGESFGGISEGNSRRFFDEIPRRMFERIKRVE